MAQLRIEQVKAPDFSASSEMMARANESFQTGIESAKGILGKYNEGQQAKNDNVVLNEFAKAGSVEELDALLRSDMLLGLNISDPMKQYVAGLRSELIGNDQTRASTESTRAATSRANAAEGRVAAEYDYNVGQREALASATPAVLAAYQEGRGNGSRDTGAAADWLAYDNQNATRNDPLAPELVDAMSFVGEMGLTMRVASGGQEDNGPNGTGSTRHNHGNAADVDFYTPDGRKLDWNNPNDLPIFQQIVAQAKANGVTGIGAGDDYMGAGRMHVGFGNPGVWGAGGSGDTAPQWLRDAYAGAPAGAPRNPATTSVGTGGQANRDLQTLLGTLDLPPDVALNLLKTSYDAQGQGDTAIAAAEALRQAEVAAAAQRDAILNPNNLSQDAVTRDLLSIDGVSAATALETANQNRDRFAGVIAPATTPDTEVSAALERTRATDATGVANDPVVRSFQLAEGFDASENMGADVLGQFDVPEGSGLDAAYVNRRITDLADEAGVTPGEMAATLSSVAEGNFNQFNDMISAASDTDMYSTIMSLAERNYGEAAKSEYNSRLASGARVEAERASAELQLSTARTRAAKLPAGSAERRAAEAEIANLRDTIVAGMTPKEREANLRDYVSKTGMASRLQGLDPESPEFFRAMADLEAAIQADDTLTKTEKELLLRDVRG